MASFLEFQRGQVSLDALSLALMVNHLSGDISFLRTLGLHPFVEYITNLYNLLLSHQKSGFLPNLTNQLLSFDGTLQSSPQRQAVSGIL